ncbi:MAG: hypothetical protein U0599_26240 [Vicinamibacteria bacterium]
MEAELVVPLTSFDGSGAAVAHVGEERLVVHGAIPGERARVRPVRPLAPGRTLAELVEVVEPSPFRVTPRCRHAAVCGGCTWQHVAYEEQLRAKARRLEAVLARALGERAPAVAPMIGMPAGADGMPWGYRQKSSFVLAPGPSGRGLVMGHYARGTHDVVAADECPVHPPRANRVAFALRDALAAARVSGASEDLRRGTARHVVLRTTRDESECVAMLVVGREDPAVERPLRALLDSPDAPSGLAVNLNDRPGPYLVGRETRRVHGPGHVRETSLGPAFLVSPTSFFQTNVAAASVLVDLVVRACEGSATSGGACSTCTRAAGSSRCRSPRAATRSWRSRPVARARATPSSTAARTASPRSGSLSWPPTWSALPRLAEEEPFDAVVLDPPRDGCPPAVLRAVFRRLKPKRAVVVSCNPEALGGELAEALAAGYRVLSLQPVDMFPHTPHVEAVAVLARGGGAVSGGRPPAGGRPAPTPRTPSSRSRTPGSRRPRAPGRSRTP